MLFREIISSKDVKYPHPKSWHDVARKTGKESQEYQLIHRMSFASRLAVFSLRPWLNHLGNWIATIKLHFWRTLMNERESRLQIIYRVKVKETLSRSIANLVGDVAVLPQENGETVLVGSFIGQPALRGLLDRLWNLNITILSVERVDDRKAADSAQES